MTLVQRKATWAVVISVVVAASGVALIAQGVPGIDGSKTHWEYTAKSRRQGRSAAARKR